MVAHEFFHLWTAERIHVEALQRPDYTQPFTTGTIWVNEGITEYMSRHVLLHAGFLDEAGFLARFATGALSRPSRKSWTDVSRAAVEWRNLGELMQFAQAMYEQGPRTILALDLTMRQSSDGERGVLDLLRFLRHAYVDHGRGFGEQEMRPLIDGIAQASMRDFYDRFIDGKEQPDVQTLLAAVIGMQWQGGVAVPMPDPSPEQQRARADFFSATGRP
jgi:predicted metalloprotease with PDZ domain